jgi:hypothetical protein
MATVAERVSVVEVQVINLNEKIDDVKFDIKEMHDCLDNTRDIVTQKLDVMTQEYRANSNKFFEHADKLHAEDAKSHAVLASKVEELEKFKLKWMYLFMGGFAVFGWVSGHMDLIAKLFGL